MSDANLRAGSSPSWVERGDWVLIAAAPVLYFFVLPHGIFGDGTFRYRAIQEWLSTGHLSAIKWPLIGSIFSAPLFLLGGRLGNAEWWVSRYNVVLFSGAIASLYWLLRRRIDHDVLRAFLLLLCGASMLTHELITYGAETFNAVLVAAGLAAWLEGRWTLASVLLALGIANMPATLPGVVLALASWSLRHHRLRAVVPVAAAIALWFGENYLRFGSVLNPGYAGDHGERTLLPFSGLPGFSYPLFFGALSLLLSFGKGLVFFAPGLAFAPALSGSPDGLRALGRMWLWHLAGVIAVYSQWWAWYSGAWGARFVMFAAFPASLLLAQQMRRPSSHLAILTFSLIAALGSAWASANGQVYSDYAQGVCGQYNYAIESFCWYLPEFSVLWQPFIVRKALSLSDVALLSYALIVFVWTASGAGRLWMNGIIRCFGDQLRRLRTGPAWKI